MFLRVFEGIYRKFQISFMSLSRKFLEYFKEVSEGVSLPYQGVLSNV